MEIKITGLEETLRKFEVLQRNAKALDGRHQVPMAELFDPTFMRRYTRATNFETLIEAGGFHVESTADFEAIPDAEWEAVVQKHTSFASWKEMKEKAVEEYAAKKPFLVTQNVGLPACQEAYQSQYKLWQEQEKKAMASLGHLLAAFGGKPPSWGEQLFTAQSPSDLELIRKGARRLLWLAWVAFATFILTAACFVGAMVILGSGLLLAFRRCRAVSHAGPCAVRKIDVSEPTKLGRQNP